MIQTDENIKRYISQFESFEKSLNGELKSPIHTIRRSAIEQFLKLGFPTTKDEEWRFTNITPLIRTQFIPSFENPNCPVSEKQLEEICIKKIPGQRLVFIDGRYSNELSIVNPQQNHIQIGSLAEAIKKLPELVHQHLSQNNNGEKNAFTALNLSFLQDGAYIKLPDGTTVENPVYLLFVSTGEDKPIISHPRNLIIAGDDCQVSIIEHYVGVGMNPYFTNTVTQIEAGKNSIIEHSKIQNESAKAFHIGSIYIKQNEASTVTSNSIMIGGEIVRNNITALLAAERIKCTMNGLLLASGQQLIDNHTTIDHAKPHCSSHELFKAILGGRSKGVFNGKIYVRKDAQKTDAKQTNKTLLLSDTATINTKPQLEIFADDVKCTHGATTGFLDADSIFYLRSRGISKDIARDILTYAFANDIINRISIQPIREHLNNFIYSRLKQGRQLENM